MAHGRDGFLLRALSDVKLDTILNKEFPGEKIQDRVRKDGLNETARKILDYLIKDDGDILKLSRNSCLTRIKRWMGLTSEGVAVSSPVASDGTLPDWSESTISKPDINAQIIPEEVSGHVQSITPATYRHPMKGLKNMGNTCYLNATLQVLMASSKFVQHLKRYGDLNHNKCSISNLLRDVFLDNSADALRRLCSKLKDISPMLVPKEQQDAGQFYGCLMDKVGEEDFLTLKGEHEKEAAIIAFRQSNHTPFGGLWRKEIQCSRCGTKSAREEAFTEIAVPALESTLTMNLNKFFFEKSVLTGENSYKCDQCKSLVPACETVRITKQPKILAVTLKRFNDYGQKSNNVPVTAPEKLCLDLYTLTDSDTEPQLIYDYLGMVEHIGTSISEGHYIAKVKTDTERYCVFDDLHVKFVGKESALTSTDSTLLLYEQREVNFAESSTDESSREKELELNVNKPVGKIPVESKVDQPVGSIPLATSSTSELENKEDRINNRRRGWSSSSSDSSLHLNGKKIDDLFSSSSDADTEVESRKMKSRVIKRTISESSDAEDFSILHDSKNDEKEQVDESVQIDQSDGFQTIYGKKLKARGETLRFSAKPYKKFEFSIKISAEDWKKCVTRDLKGQRSMNHETWTDTILTYFEKNDKEYHTVNFKSFGKLEKSKKRGLSYDAYAYCRDGSCKHFVVAVEISDFKCVPLIEVYSRGTTSHPANVKCTRQLNGERKRRTQKKLKKIKTAKFQDKQLKKLDDDAYAEGHLQSIHSDAVIQNVRSAALAEGDLHPNDMIDIHLKSMAEKPDERFIQRAATPMQVILFSKEQVKSVLSQFKSWKLITVHVDATGSLVRNPPGVKGRIYLYAGVVNIIGTIVPLFEMISVKHDQGGIGDVMSYFRSYCVTRLRKKWPCIGRVISDCSYATIHAVMVQFNHMDLHTYLRVCYKFVCGSYTDSDFGKLIVLMLCHNHWQKMTSNNLKSHSVGKEKRHVILECMAALMACQSMDDFEMKFRAMACLLLSDKVYQLTSQSAEILVIGSRTEAEVLGTGPEPDPEDIEELVINSDENLTSSPFFKACFAMLLSVKNQIKEEKAKLTENEMKVLRDNPAYCPRYLKDVFMPKCSPLVPLWTELMSNTRGSYSYASPSNAVAEDYFKIEKESTHRDSMHNKVGRYVDKERDYIHTKLIKVDKKLITNSKTFRKYASTKREAHAQSMQNSTPLNADQKHDLITRNTLNDSDSFKVNPLKQGLAGEQQQELWKLQLSERKKKRSYADGNAIRKQFLERNDVSDIGSDIDDPPPANDIFDECSKEFWASPPGSKVKSVQRPSAAKQAFTAKQSARKMLTDLFTSREITDEEVIHTKTYPPVNALECTYYSQYAVPPLSAFRNLQLVPKLTNSERKYVWETCRGDGTRPVLIYGELDRYLPLECLYALLDGKEISSATVDACLDCLQHNFTNDDICVLSSTEGCEIFQCEYSRALSVNKKNFKNYSFVIVPYLLPGHWVLCLIDFKSSTFQLLDPSGANPADEKILHGTFQAYFMNCYNTKINLRCNQSRQYHLQSDQFSCGVFVLKYTESLLRYQDLSEFDVNEYRVHLAQLIINRGKEILEESQLKAENTRSLLHSRYANGLFKSIDYYVSQKESLLEEEMFTVCSLGEGLKNINSQLFSNLVCGRWLDNYMIDALFHINMTDELRTQFLNIRVAESEQVFSGPNDANCILCNISISNKTLIMPQHVNSNHWCLIIADMRKKTYLYLDPLNLNNTSYKKGDFLAFLKARNAVTNDYVDYTGWKAASSAKFPPQNDAINCGIYVVYYGLCVMQGKKPSKAFSPGKYRKDMASLLLERCPTMRHLCLKCGSSEYSTRGELIGVMVQCDTCRRWLHKRCDQELTNLTKDEIQNSDFVFCCALCTIAPKPSKKRKIVHK